MALVQYGDRRLSALGTLITAARTAYRYRNVLQNTYNMVKRTYDNAFGGYSPRGTVSKRTRWNNSKPYNRPWRRRWIRSKYRRTKAQRILNPRRNRRRGRRVPPNRDITLRANMRHLTTFEAQPGLEVDWSSKKVEMDSPGDWIPRPEELTALTRCRFDHCNTKKLKSVHVYMKNISVTTWYDQDQTVQLVSQPGDTYIYTYAEQRRNNVSHSMQADFIRNQGLTKKLIRNQADFHRILKANCFARNATTETLDELQTKTWKAFTQEQDFYNKTGTTDTTGNQARLNLDWLINVDTPYVPPDTNTVFKCKVEYDLVVATKWRLYGTKDS